MSLPKYSMLKLGITAALGLFAAGCGGSDPADTAPTLPVSSGTIELTLANQQSGFLNMNMRTTGLQGNVVFSIDGEQQLVVPADSRLAPIDVVGNTDGMHTITAEGIDTFGLPVITAVQVEIEQHTDDDLDGIPLWMEQRRGTDPDDPTNAPPTTAAPETNGIEIPEPGGEIAGETPCPAVDGSSERITSFEQAPPTCIDGSKSYSAIVSTTKGDYTVELDAAAAPNTVNNFIVLARYHYYDDVAFHRIIPGFVVQGGDAVGPTPGVGNPGYQFDDELHTPDPDTGFAYEIGSVAMANSGVNTNGSQFFIVTGESGTSLPPLYSKFGKVTDGLDVVLDIESSGTSSGAPREAITITSIEILEQ